MSTTITTEQVLTAIDTQWRTPTDILNRVERQYGQDILSGEVFVCLKQLEANGQIEKTTVKEPDQTTSRIRYRLVGTRQPVASPAGGLAPA